MQIHVYVYRHVFIDVHKPDTYILEIRRCRDDYALTLSQETK